ncbi:hypothetical protein IFM89_033731 [Coptis chinensis]|uniref:Uncharacterized protein n=1 Tax=Coptis chinensis TaxID=261450 RepID=A0A835H2D6_9MAGN|nr:hypothetical protein IFM89_033731 [Coptis chinensis]
MAVGEASVEDLRQGTLPKVAIIAHRAICEVTNEEHFLDLIDWIESHKPGMFLAKILLGIGGPSVIVTSGRQYSLFEVDMGFGPPVVGTYYSGLQRLCAAYFNPQPSSRGDGSWVVFSMKEYNVDDAYKKINLKKVAKSFREFKHRLRVKYYDKYDNDVDRKRNCSIGVKLEELEKFVDNESKPSRKRMRTKGKVAREAVKALHTLGRRGAARTVHDMKSKNPNVKVTRTDSYMAIHTHKDDSFIAPERMERIKAIIEDDPASVNLDLDHDPVA